VSFDDFWPDDPITRELQRRYIADNVGSTGSKHLLDSSSVEDKYDKVHLQHHPNFRRLLDRFGFYDAFLIDAEAGRIVYSVHKEVDFGTSLVSGPYRDSGLSRAYARARSASDADFVTLQDFEPYAPSYDDNAAFFAAPIFDAGNLVGVLAFQMSIARLNAVMTSDEQWEAQGFGQSGETYLVGADKNLRSEPRFLLEDKEAYLEQLRQARVSPGVVEGIAQHGSAIGIQPVDTSAVEAALQGRTGVATQEDYRSVEVFSAFAPIDVGDVNWVLLSEIDRAEALAPAEKVRMRGILVVLGALALVILIAFLFADRLVRPIRELVERARRIRDGDLAPVAYERRADELGILSESLDAMRESIADFIARQERALEALAAPVIPLASDIVAVPLVGELDRLRVNHARETIVASVHVHRRT
jgi:methyl-accepting chemotaxis protein